MKKLTVLLFLVLTFSPVFAQSNSAQTYRVYYMGKIDETPAFLEMLITDLSVSGVLGFRQETMFSVAISTELSKGSASRCLEKGRISPSELSMTTSTSSIVSDPAFAT